VALRAVGDTRSFKMLKLSNTTTNPPASVPLQHGWNIIERCINENDDCRGTSIVLSVNPSWANKHIALLASNNIAEQELNPHLMELGVPELSTILTFRRIGALWKIYYPVELVVQDREANPLITDAIVQGIQRQLHDAYRHGLPQLLGQFWCGLNPDMIIPRWTLYEQMCYYWQVREGADAELAAMAPHVRTALEAFLVNDKQEPVLPREYKIIGAHNKNKPMSLRQWTAVYQ